MSKREYQQTRTVELPENVVDELEERLPATRFESIDEYAAVALEMLLLELRGDPAPTDGSRASDSAEGTPEDEQAVKDQLESLGYL